MEKYFATYNQSLALKELGFDEPCLAVYAEGSKQLIINNTIRNWNDQLKNGNTTSAPLKSQVFDWFREKHLLSAHIDDFTANNGQVRYDFSIRELGSQDDNPNGMYEEYSDAESACIDALIKRVKERIK